MEMTEAYIENRNTMNDLRPKWTFGITFDNSLEIVEMDNSQHKF